MLAGCLDAGLLGYTIYIIRLKLVFGGDRVYQRIDSDRIMNPETGEIFMEHTVIKKPHEYVQIKDPYMQKRNVKHVKVRTAREQKRAYLKLTLEERGFLFSILPYVAWETNLLIGDGEYFEKNKPLTWANVDKIAGIDRRTRTKLVHALEDKKVIGYMVVKHGGKLVKAGIVISPDFVLRGKKPQEELLRVFNSTVNVWEDDSE